MSFGNDEIFEQVRDLPDGARQARVRELCDGDERRVAVMLSLLSRAAAFTPDGEEEDRERKLPCRLGPYTLLQEIGRGAHGVVYRAEHGDVPGQVALKLLDRKLGAGLRAVLREAGAARQIPSEHVVAVHAAGELPDGTHYIEMTLCADVDPEVPGAIRLGTSLRTAVEGPGLTPDDAAAILEAACHGVEAAHDIQIVHGDVKPDNVLVTPPRVHRRGEPESGPRRRVMLADFGIATSLAGNLDPEVAKSFPKGTPAFMAPEQWRDGSPPTRASDVYMLGGTLLFAATGLVPHPDRDLADFRAIDPPRAPTPGNVPERLRAVIDKALSSDPGSRHRSAAALADDLRCFRTGEPTSIERENPLLVAELRARKHAALLGFAAMAALLVAGLYWVHSRQISEKDDTIGAQGVTIGDLQDKGEKVIGNIDRNAGKIATELSKQGKQLSALSRTLEKTQGAVGEANDKLAAIPGNLLGIQKLVYDTGEGIRQETKRGLGEVASGIADVRNEAEEREEKTGKAIEALAGRLVEMEKERLRAEGEAQKRLTGMEKALGETREEVRRLKAEARPIAGGEVSRGVERVK